MCLKYLYYSVILLAFCGSLILQATVYPQWPLWGHLIVAYAFFSVAFLVAAYAGHESRFFLKSSLGQLSPLSWLLLGPYLLMNALVFRVYCASVGKDAYIEVHPNLFFGRRLTASESARAVASGWLSVLDLAVEFSEIEPFRNLAGYRSLPLLDATAPTVEQLRDAVAWILNAQSKGPVYVHCALGHGRSACVIAAYLVSTKSVRNIEDAVAHLQESRPGVRLNHAQTTAIRHYIQDSKLSV